MFDSPAHAREHYSGITGSIGTLTRRIRRTPANGRRGVLRQGVTFTVYGDTQGTGAFSPFDLMPRIIPRKEWGAWRSV